MHINIQTASQLLLLGQVVGLPTETVYGLAARLAYPEAIQQIFRLKGRPLKNPLIIHVAQREEVDLFATSLPPLFHELTARFWPGPLTLIVPILEEYVPSIVRAGLTTAGFRMPAHQATLKILESTGPLVMPSANLSGRPSATRPEHVEADFGQNFPVVDGGTSAKGVESTILIFEGHVWKIARLGALAVEAFAKVLGYEPIVIERQNGKNPICPGQLFRHYAPRAQLILGDKDRMYEADVIIGFNERDYGHHPRVIYLGSITNPAQAAENLYHTLRQLDIEYASTAWVDTDFPRHGLWQTIEERLQRAK